MDYALIDPADTRTHRSRSESGHPIGLALPDWTARPRPTAVELQGCYSVVEPLATGHADRLFAAYSTDRAGLTWLYMNCGPFTDSGSLSAWVERVSGKSDPLFFYLESSDRSPIGIAALMRIVPEMGCIEIGSITLTPEMKGTRESTEALYLLIRHAFDDLGYRRLEWKCDALNAASRRSALRLGFRFEGIFLNAMVYKGRNRDTAWFAITDTEWPQRRDVFELWLEPSNFDEAGQQRRSLSQLRDAYKQGEQR